jgi:hypothetical protein
MFLVPMTISRTPMPNSTTETILDANSERGMKAGSG